MTKIWAKRWTFVSASVLSVSAVLTGCSMIPDLAPESLAANRSACESVTSVWNSLTNALDPTALTNGQALQSSSETLAGIPDLIESAIEGSTDAELDSSLTALKEQIDALSTGAQVDVASIAAAGASLATRCVVFGVTPNLTLPGM